MSIPKTHTVYRLTSKGLDGLEKSTENVPSIKPNEVLIKVKAVSLNSRDLQIINGRYPMPAIDNVVPCSDLSGKVVSIGESVEGFNVGDKVISNFKYTNVWDMSAGLEGGLGASADGTLREYVVLPYEAVNKINNSDISWEEAASLVCTGVTSWNALYGLKKLQPGDVVLVLGTGGVSLTALSIAKKAGAVTIATSSSDEKLKELDGLVDYAINYSTYPEWADQVLKLTNGKGADFVVENGGAGTIKESIKATASEGVISLIGFVAPRPKKMPDVYTAAFMRGAILRGIRVGNKQMALDLIKFVENKGLNIKVDKVFKFHNDEVVDAFKLLESSKQVGKICISFDSTVGSSKL